MKERTREILMAIPHIVMLMGRLATDKRIPNESKMAIVGAAAYLVSPIDLVPDFIPVFGQLEDLMILLLVVDGVLNHLDRAIVRELWSGDPEMLDKISSFAGKATAIVPGFIKRKLFHESFYAREAGPGPMRSSAPNGAPVGAPGSKS